MGYYWDTSEVVRMLMKIKTMKGSIETVEHTKIKCISQV